VLQGSWIRPGGVVVEAGFASALGLHVGDRLSLGGSSYEVVGIAVTAAFPTYGQVCYSGCFLVGNLGSYDPGLVWVNDADITHLAGVGSQAVFYVLNLKLHDAAAASAFADRYNANTSPTAPAVFSWQTIRGFDAKAIAQVQQVLLFGTSLLSLLAIASVVVLAGGRMAEQTRRVGLLKAVGGTPEFVAIVLLIEHVLVGLGAAGVALLLGWLAVPLAFGPGASLLGAPSAASLSASAAALVVALAVAVAIVSTFVPAIRAARQSTVAALEDSARVPPRRAWAVRLSASMPAPLLLGTRLAVRRPRRLVLNVFSVAVTMSGLFAVLTAHASAGNFLKPNVAEATTIISVLLVLLASVNAVIIAWATALDARHSAAVARALGATPEQITTGLAVAQLLPALAGALLGILGGIGIVVAAKSGGTTAFPPAAWLVVMLILTLLVLGLLTAITSRIGASRPVAEVLQPESA
jgi:putative ABC transport system permease protein